MTGPLTVLALAALAWASPAAAVEPAPLLPPPPDLVPLVPFVAAPIDKPPVTLPALARPALPGDLPTLPPAAVRTPAAERPVAFVPAPGPLACVGALIGLPAQALECGRERFRKGDWEGAAQALERAVRGGGDADLDMEARYWLGETLLRLGRTERADWLFQQVAQGSPRGGEFVVWALNAQGYTALEVRDWARARQAFERLLRGPLPVPVAAWARHGLGLAAYALGRYQEAADAWLALRTAGVPPALARDVLFWLGEARARTGRPAEGAAELAQFVRGGDHPLLATARVRLGWWSLEAGRAEQAADAFRAALGAPGPERDWAEAGLALALLARDAEGARKALGALQARSSPLVLPVALRLIAALADAGKPADAATLGQALLAGDLQPAVRAWVLVVQGEAARAAGDRDEARTRFDLARQAAPGSPTAAYATLRLAQTNFEMREFGQAARDLAALLAAGIPAAMRPVALLLQGEAAYQAGDWKGAGEAFRRLLAETPEHPEAPMARLSVAWTVLRLNRPADARREFLAFATAYPGHPRTPEALLLAAELALADGDLAAARGLLDRIVRDHPTHPRAGFARLNRALLLMRQRDDEAIGLLADWIARAPFPPLLGRAYQGYGAALLAAGRAAEAEAAFARARREGVGAPAALGLGATALVQARWDLAGRLFAEARDAGTPPVVAAAEYGLAAVAFHRGTADDFKRAARAALDAAPTGPTAPRLLYVLAGLAVRERDWAGALAGARRLVQAFPRSEFADDALARVLAGAAGARAWPEAYEAGALLRQAYPTSPFVQTTRVTFAEAQLETGRAAAARQELEIYLASVPAGPPAARALLALARAQQLLGDDAGTLGAYERAAQVSDPATWDRPSRLGRARALARARRWGEARAALAPMLRAPDRATVAEVALLIGATYRDEGQPLTAAEYFMTAAYVAPTEPAGRRALIEAAASFTALKQPEAAATVYRKLLAQADVPADLAALARDGLRSLGREPPAPVGGPPGEAMPVP